MSRAPGRINFRQVIIVDLETIVVPGLLTSNQIPCIGVTAVAGKESLSMQSCRRWTCCRHWARGCICTVRRDQSDNATVRCFAGGGWMLMKPSTVIFEILWIQFWCQAACFCWDQFMAELCVYRELLGCPLKCLNNIVSTWYRLICILATVSSSWWAKNPNGNQTIWSLRALKAENKEKITRLFWAQMMLYFSFTLC